MADDVLFATQEEFWDHLFQCADRNKSPVPEQLANELLVRFIKAVADHVHIYVNTDQDIYHAAVHLIHSPLWDDNRCFCIAKLLSLLSVAVLPLNVQFVASYMLLLDAKNDSSLLQLVQDYDGFRVLYRCLHSSFRTLSVLDKDASPVGTVQTMRQMCTIQLDMLFQICKYLSLTSEELSQIDTFFINYIFESLVVAYDEEDVFNSAKFKFILAVNEQFMIMSRNDKTLKNMVFETLATHKTSTNFNECLLVYFNREEDRCLQILISKILYIIFNNDRTNDMFYHNDLNVLVDVLIRELNDLSEDEESIRNTFLRVLYPILQNKQFSTTRYKKSELKALLNYLSGQSGQTFWIQSETTKRLANRCLSIDWLSSDNVSSSQESVSTSPSTSTPSTPFHLSHNDSETSLNSISKRRPPPPPPHPRKTLVNNRTLMYSTAASTNALR